MELAGRSMRGNRDLRDQQQSLTALSKVLTLGRDHRLFFNTYVNDKNECDITSAAATGYALDFDIFKQTFVLIKDYEVDENNKLIDKSGMPDLSRLAYVIHEATYNKEREEAKEEAERTAKKLDTEINASALEKRLLEIELEYKGNPDATPPIYASKRPPIGRFSVVSMTECLVVPLNSDGSPDTKGIKVASLDLSKKKETQLIALLDNASYCDPNCGYLEVGYNYVGADKGAAGRDAALQGVSNELSLKVKFPQWWESQWAGLYDRISATGEAVRAKNRMFSSKITPKEVQTRLEAYLSKSRIILAYLDVESDSVKKNAELLMKYPVIANEKKVAKALTAIIEEQNSGAMPVEKQAAEVVDISNDVTGSDVKEASGAESVRDLKDVKTDELAGDAITGDAGDDEIGDLPT